LNVSLCCSQVLRFRSFSGAQLYFHYHVCLQLVSFQRLGLVCYMLVSFIEYPEQFQAMRHSGSTRGQVHIR